MNLFFSGGPLDYIEPDPRLPPGMRYRLNSCHKQYLNQARTTVRGLISVGQPFEWMLDSGAFTSWSQGHEVDRDELASIYDEMIELAKGKPDHVWLISLDKIPGERGRTATEAELQEAIDVSDKNFFWLKERFGPIVLPVFHQNESTERLLEVAAMAEYICVSPRNDLHEESRRLWSMEVHERIPGKRTHGLAATGYDMMRMVPWHSVDSATWVLLAANGTIFKNERLQAMHISDQSSAKKDANQHFRTLPLPQQKAFAAMVGEMGFDLKKMEEEFFERLIFNRVMMTKAYRAIPSQAEVAKAVPVVHSLFDL